ncbi:MAG: hypothetical protein Q4P18_02320 [Methanobrevibacter sp.]|uniref:hypothetical protein n=1 Tax=Methanobrevibacter sp. TaxID=66852 RepID=UPI0026DFE369|nr:hypothetical protein [Methanobrevibacter sp.]MDO5848346.1 hypothetical protein [Methanobrevibacter sp.]
MKKIAFVLIFSLMMITAVSAIDADDWKTVKIKGHDFKIPPKYNNGDLKNGKYTIGNWRNFEISCIDNSLPMVYGFADSDDAYMEDMDINGHAVRYFNEYNNAEKANVSKVFFSVGQSVYMISWKSNEFSEDVKDIISSSESSNLTSGQFYDILREALNQYHIQEQNSLNTPDPVYVQSDNSYHKNDDFVRYYLTYKLLQDYKRGY